MADELPPAPVDSDADLQDFPYLPLDVQRLRDSRFAAMAKPEEFHAAVMLWCAAWHQSPPGSLPLDDDELARLAGYGRGVREFRKVRDGALYGWSEHSDGRLYHELIAEKVRTAWASKLQQRYRREVDRIRKENARRERESITPRLRSPSTFEEWDAARKAGGVPLERFDFSAGNFAASAGKKPVAERTPQESDPKGSLKGSEASSTPLPPSQAKGGDALKRTWRNPRRERKAASADAWGRVLLHYKDDAFEALKNADPIAAQAVGRIGGFSGIGQARTSDMGKVRAQFRDCYEALLEKRANGAHS